MNAGTTGLMFRKGVHYDMDDNGGFRTVAALFAGSVGISVSPRQQQSGVTGDVHFGIGPQGRLLTGIAGK